MKIERSALYAWGGPGTVRLLHTKYFSPRIDVQSFLRMYEPHYLDMVKRTFGTTDMFVSYSWGFSDATEQEDRAYIVQRLPHFQERTITTYAYVQGLNLVLNEFDQDLWCRSPQGSILMYSKGRAFICPNNPNVSQLIKQRISDALIHPFDNIYVDNMLFGLPPLFVYQNHVSFYGCACKYCQRIPHDNYHQLRVATMKNLISELSTMVRNAGKGFGINLYDPYWHTAPYYFGYDFEQIRQYLDYFVIENHALSADSVDNTHIPFPLDKPTFVVSYRNGIGRDSAYAQRDFDHIYSESLQLSYIPCYKATEFKTNGVWHGLDPSMYSSPKQTLVKTTKSTPVITQTSVRAPYTHLLRCADALYSRFAPIIPQHRLLSYLLLETPIYTRAIRKRRYIAL